MAHVTQDCFDNCSTMTSVRCGMVVVLLLWDTTCLLYKQHCHCQYLCQKDLCAVLGFVAFFFLACTAFLVICLLNINHPNDPSAAP